MTRIRLLSFALLLFFNANARAQELHSNSFFSYSNALPKLTAKSGVQQRLVTHSIKINRDVAALDTGDVLVFPLPGGKKVDIAIVKKGFTQNGDTQIKGTFGVNGDGTAIITIGADATYASITSPNYNYSIGLDANQDAFLVNNKLSNLEIDLSDDMVFPSDFEPMEHLKGAAQTPNKLNQNASKSGKSEVTLLIVYSKEFAEGFANPLTRINQMIAFTNDAYDRSGINIELKLAHAQQINFNNSTNIGTLLTQVGNASGAFTGVPSIRNQYYADMVAVLPFSSGGRVAGIANVNGYRPNRAYSVTQFARWGSDSVFAHELGHNLGSGHERISANPGQGSPCSGGYTNYSCGHGNGSQGTIMSYLDDAAWGYVFSNPQLDCSGEPCGIASGSSNSADNKTSFNITGPLVEGFRVDTSNDDDKDGVKNDVDNCPTVKNSNQIDTDMDRIGDACDSDDDNDNVADNIDNCPLVENTEQIDTNNNGVGDACEDDELCIPLKNARSKVMVVCL